MLFSPKMPLTHEIQKMMLYRCGVQMGMFFHFTISGISLIQPSPGKRIFLSVSRKTCKICNNASLARQGQVNAHLILSYLSMIKPMLSKFKVPTPIPLSSPINIEGPSLDLLQVVNSIKHMIMDQRLGTWLYLYVSISIFM